MYAVLGAMPPAVAQSLLERCTRELDSRRDRLIALRREIHAHPELAFEERRTSELVAERLHRAGLEVRTGVARTGVIAVLHGDRAGRTVAWRADMDALPIVEPRRLPFASVADGAMHACGHDGHVAIGVIAAEILSACRDALHGTVVFIFQPAEEVFGGAEAMILEGALDDPRVDEVFGLHLSTSIACGRMELRAGQAMAGVDAFEITVVGKGTHGAMPALGIDPIVAASHFVIATQGLCARELAPGELAVLTIGEIHAGSRPNVIPDRAVLRGSLRTFDPRSRGRLLARLEDMTRQIAGAHRAEAQVSWLGDGCPPLVNDGERTARARECLCREFGREAVGEAPLLPVSDDMSRFLDRRPGCYFRVGAGLAGRSAPHHSPEFELDEAALEHGVRAALAVLTLASLGS